MRKKRDEIKVEAIDLEEFTVLLVKSRPPRLEAKVIFGKEHISQKLVFTLMDISHKHGFGCSSPKFGLPYEDAMTFLIGTPIPTQKSAGNYLSKMYECLLEITEFSNDFIKQLDFTRLDLTMFADADVENIFPEQLAAIRDQNYDGSWKEFYRDLVDEGQDEEADIVVKCIKFEELNKKDIGLVGHKLEYIFQGLEKKKPREELN